jgi:tRNA(His) 5'-end guanylyltransferase
LRIDGKAFHTFTRGFNRPFDKVLNKTMQETTKYLCENIQGCKIGYTQSDEISLLLTDYDTIDTDAWFDYEVQKMCSIASSMATLAFNRFFAENVNEFIFTEHSESLEKSYRNAVDKGAMFDCRAFNIPKEEVSNYFYWRQVDATRNSVSMVARAYFSDKELFKKGTSQMKEMLLNEKNVDWNTIEVFRQRGSAVIKTKLFIPVDDLKHIPKSEQLETFEGKQGIWRNQWSIDLNIPMFKDSGRDYIEKLVNI